MAQRAQTTANQSGHEPRGQRRPVAAAARRAVREPSHRERIIGRDHDMRGLAAGPLSPADIARLLF